MTSTSGRISDKKAADSPEPSRLLKMASGSISGLLVSVVLQPLDVVRTTMQTEAAKSANRPQVVPTVRSIITEGGVQALWRGSSATVVRLGLGAGLHFLFIDIAKSALQRPMPDGRMGLSPGAAALAGGCARALSAAALCPVTLVKTRLEYGRGEQMYRGPVMAVRQIYTAEGARGLFRGLGPTILTNAPFSGLYYMFYTQLQVAAARDGPPPPSFLDAEAPKATDGSLRPLPSGSRGFRPGFPPCLSPGIPSAGTASPAASQREGGAPRTSSRSSSEKGSRGKRGSGGVPITTAPVPLPACLILRLPTPLLACSLSLSLPPSLPAIRIAHLRSEIAFLRSRSFSELVFGLPFWSLPSLCSTFFASMFVSPSEKWDGRLTIARHLKSGLGFAELVSGRAADCGSGPEGGGTLLAARGAVPRTQRGFGKHLPTPQAASGACAGFPQRRGPEPDSSQLWLRDDRCSRSNDHHAAGGHRAHPLADGADAAEDGDDQGAAAHRLEPGPGGADDWDDPEDRQEGPADGSRVDPLRGARPPAVDRGAAREGQGRSRADRARAGLATAAVPSDGEPRQRKRGRRPLLRRQRNELAQPAAEHSRGSRGRAVPAAVLRHTGQARGKTKRHSASRKAGAPFCRGGPLL
eukprot:CAMPEP_0177591214 /NCGR_PEP_ID=MMETSP0419_2-20121207/7872_1 /TAXON_ID=582737 /ORGANISM="Tetraselmis sp., Strain GSL018" /LENGTH=637 /DNA_ID=CAMNT_0019081929 /DNA_START=119 /DNA_END=2028 /DNA_ORIENTATION=+